MLLSHSKGLLPASYGITVCIHVYFGSYREPAIPLQKIITCIRVGSTFPPPRAIIAHSAGIVQFFQFFFFNPPIILSSSKPSPSLLFFSPRKSNRCEPRRLMTRERAVEYISRDVTKKKTIKSVRGVGRKSIRLKRIKHRYVEK